MKYTLKSGLTIGILVAALAMTGGCGDNDNSGDENGNGPIATRTATAPSPTPRGPTPTGVVTTTGAVTPTGVVATGTATGPSPNPTPTGGIITQTVDFDFTAANGIQAFQVRVAYPIANGSFTNSAENVNCNITGGGGIFTKNDNDSAGTLTLSVANTSNLTFPVNVECTFDATTAIVSGDLTVTVQEVTQNNGPGNIADLMFAVTITNP